MRSRGAKWSPTSRGVRDVEARIERLRRYELWRPAEAVDFERIVGSEAWRTYWKRLEAMDRTLAECQACAADKR